MQFPKIMGILNATPDSFSDGMEKFSLQRLLNKAKILASSGADIIDIGGESTRPNAIEVSVEEELNRVIPIVTKMQEELPNIPISIDTRKAEVAALALKLGVEYINDISGLKHSPEIAAIISKYKNSKLIIMHSRPHDEPKPYENILEEVHDFLESQIKFACNSGVAINNIISDVGIGFGKNYEDNISLLKNLEYFDDLGVPQLLGISRKRLIGDISNIKIPYQRDETTMFLHSLLLNIKSVKIIRVHNVSLANNLKKTYNALYN